MNPTWWTPEKVELLVAAAESWRGTPFAPNSQSKGQGVCCHTLAAALYVAAGFNDFELPEVPISHARFSRESIIIPWFNVRTDFDPVDPFGDLLPGDVLAFEIGRCVHHIGVLLPGRQFAHALEGIGATIATLDDATWISRLANVWRPKP
jgi:hypothetical protein